MSKFKIGGLDPYDAEPFEQQQFGTAGVEGVKRSKLIDVLTAATSESSTLARRTLPHMYGIVWYRGRDGSSSSSSSM